jgi:hypothetical protein
VVLQMGCFVGGWESKGKIEKQRGRKVRGERMK